MKKKQKKIAPKIELSNEEKKIIHFLTSRLARQKVQKSLQSNGLKIQLYK